MVKDRTSGGHHDNQQGEHESPVAPNGMRGALSERAEVIAHANFLLR
jgi:hypothetical protein